MLGGALGAKGGEFLSTLMRPEQAFEWIESAMLLGSLGGMLLTLIVLTAVSYSSARKDAYEVYNPGKETSVSRA